MDQWDAISSVPVACIVAQSLIPLRIVSDYQIIMGSGPVTHPDLLPRHLIEEHIATLLLLGTHLHRLR